MSTSELFADLDAWNQDHPDYFDLDPLVERQRLPIGCLVQVATAAPAHDWLWVEILERTPFGYRGVVDCVANPEASPHVGNVVDLSARHIHQTYARQAVTPTATYAQLLADAQRLEGRKGQVRRLLEIERDAFFTIGATRSA